ncbi:hypothetical protein BU23DRAFT_576033 [Bimuria novae-zelandiae CBS 107.79]|uniref:Uncharacterized protein n=1 Tax=Bimuria novae-zelandiae CBS 107.79 TaxID=1447943 RepID=A0A6A5UGV4_9PLEO|nr:hypothetical protein BU23DRAFT_576033 [Bimuria novae-zelandiae CBS 107.79]
MAFTNPLLPSSSHLGTHVPRRSIWAAHAPFCPPSSSQSAVEQIRRRATAATPMAGSVWPSGQRNAREQRCARRRSDPLTCESEAGRGGYWVCSGYQFQNRL